MSIRAALLSLMLACLTAGGAMAVDESAVKELAPTGKLRVGVAFAPAATPVFVAKDAAGDYHGVPLAIGAALAKALGVPVEAVYRPNTGDLTDACVAGTVDIGFMPVDDTRRQLLDFSPPYFMIESTFLVSQASGIKMLAEVDQASVTVVAVNGTTTIRVLDRRLKTASIVGVKSVDEAMAMMTAGTAQALALSRDSLLNLQKALPGAHIVDGAFQTSGVAIGLQKNHPAALAFVRSFVEDAKANGLLRRLFDEAGLKTLPVAPAEARH